mgnify:CR=1 FL=1
MTSIRTRRAGRPSSGVLARSRRPSESSALSAFGPAPITAIRSAGRSGSLRDEAGSMDPGCASGTSRTLLEGLDGLLDPGR